MKKSKSKHFFDQPGERDLKHEFSGNKRKRGQHNAKKTAKNKRALSSGLEGHAEKLRGHKLPGENHLNKERTYK